jgi:hypothetical protein
MKMEYPDSIDDAYFDTFDTLDTVASEATEAMMDQVLSRTTPLASLFRTRREEIPYIRDLADRIGLHFGLLKADRERDQLWIALGKSAEGVQYMLNLEQRRMPGVFTKGVILEEDVMAGAKPLYSSLGLCQVALAGVIGGLVVVYGLSLL